MDIRPSPLAGTWYPRDPTALTHDLSRYLAEANPHTPTGKIWGIVAPHAGYIYSGPVAAYAFKCIHTLRPEVVVVISPMHSGDRASILTTGHQAYGTPLGAVPVDVEAVRRLDQTLQERLGRGLKSVYNDPEHALEIELPFLQHVLGEFRLLPLMIADQRTHIVEALGRALAEVVRDRQALFVASSDLSHFYPQARARELDAELLRRVEAFDPQSVMDAEEEGIGFACGRGAIAAVLWATQALGANRAGVLRYATSGDVTGDLKAVVGYGAAAIWQATNGD